MTQKVHISNNGIIAAAGVIGTAALRRELVEGLARTDDHLSEAH